MILADKIIMLRKKAGMSQEQLAERLGVSRQSVSKWEGSQSMPDMDKAVKLADLFGLSLDSLIRDDLDVEDGVEAPSVSTDAATSDADDAPISVSFDEANAFIDATARAASRVAFGVCLCILAFVPMFLLVGASVNGNIALTEDQAGSIGIAVLLPVVAVAVGLFIVSGHALKRFERIKKNPIDTAYGVEGMVRERKNAFSGTHLREMVTGVALCIAAAVPVIAVNALEESEANGLFSMVVLLIIVSLGVALIVHASIIWGGFDALLEEEDYRRSVKRFNRSVAGPYWSVVLVLYLLSSFVTMHWEITWIIWPVAGVAYWMMFQFRHAFNR